MAKQVRYDELLFLSPRTLLKDVDVKEVMSFHVPFYISYRIASESLATEVPN